MSVRLPPHMHPSFHPGRHRSSPEPPFHGVRHLALRVLPHPPDVWDGQPGSGRVDPPGQDWPAVASALGEVMEKITAILALAVCVIIVTPLAVVTVMVAPGVAILALSGAAGAVLAVMLLIRRGRAVLQQVDQLIAAPTDSRAVPHA